MKFLGAVGVTADFQALLYYEFHLPLSLKFLQVRLKAVIDFLVAPVCRQTRELYREPIPVLQKRSRFERIGGERPQVYVFT